MTQFSDNPMKENSGKSPGAAAILSLIPGVGFLYLANYLKGIAYMIIFGGLITLITQVREGEVVIVFAMIGFYFFQIFEAYNEARKNNVGPTQNSTVSDDDEEELSLTSATFVLVLGVLFQLANLHIIKFSSLINYWPLILIAAGFKVVFEYLRKERHHE